jgi:hypothetical protein
MTLRNESFAFLGCQLAHSSSVTRGYSMLAGKIRHATLKFGKDLKPDPFSPAQNGFVSQPPKTFKRRPLFG